MALLQFMTAGLPEAAVPVDGALRPPHSGQGRRRHRPQPGGRRDREVYDFLRSVSAKYGIGFWKPSWASSTRSSSRTPFPGGVIIGTDSHTPNAGGIGMVAIGVGGADAVDDVMTPGSRRRAMAAAHRRPPHSDFD